MRFDPVITFGNVLSLIVMITVGVGGGIGIYNSLRDQIVELGRQNTTQDGTIAELRLRIENNTSMINQDRADAKDFRGEVRGIFTNISEQIAKLREDLARSGAVKSR